MPGATFRSRPSSALVREACTRAYGSPGGCMMSRFGRFLGGGLDPVKLARNIGMDCDPWQADVLRKPHQRELICAHRQAGKSATASVAAVHAAMYEPRSEERRV